MQALCALALAGIAAAADPQLVHTQIVFRHGDRTPTGTYKTDPYQESYWGLPWGELTKIGMAEQYTQGEKLRHIYQDKYRLVDSQYNSEQVSVHTAETNRCVQSAMSHMAGFYANATKLRPNIPGWPSGYTPVAMVMNGDDRLMEPGTNCQRAKEILVERLAHIKFIEWLATKAGMIETLEKYSGETLTHLFDSNIYDSARIEKLYYNLTLPTWFTDELFDEFVSTAERAQDFIYGFPDFGVGMQTESARLRGGPLLNQFIDNMQAAANGGTKKYHVYSGHDTTITALLACLGSKFAVLGTHQPDYASVLAAETWRDTDGKYSVRFLYSANAGSPFKVFTSSITGCGGGNLCDLDTFISRSEPYRPKDIIEECGRIF